MRYTHKKVLVEAFQYGVNAWPSWFQDEMDNGKVHILSAGDDYVIPSCIIEGERNQICAEGNYLIRYADGEIVVMGAERFHDRFESVNRKRNPIQNKSVYEIDVPDQFIALHGNELIIEIHFVDGSCQPFFRKGFDQDRALRQEIVDSLYESECFHPLSYESAYALIGQIIQRYFKESTINKTQQ